MVAMQTFQKMQSEYHERYRKHLQRQLLIVKPDLTPAELDEMTDSASFFNPKDSESGPDQTGLLSQRIFSLASRSLNRQKLEELRETQQEILAIERSISELHQMFVDIAIVVQQQGDLIDRVETHVDSIVDFTELAGVQVEQVVLSRRRSQRRKWICLVIIIVILIIVAIALWCTFAPSHQR